MYKGADATKALQENSLVNPTKAGRTNEYGEGLTICENGIKKELNRTYKRFGLELSGEPRSNYSNTILPVGDGFGFIIFL